MKFDLNRFLEDKNSIFRLMVLFVLIAIYIAPGVLIVAYVQPDLLVELSEIKLFFLCAAISLPLHFLATLLIIAPRPTLVEIAKDPSLIRKYVLSVGALVWAVLLLLIIPAVAEFIGHLYPSFSELNIRYQLLYTYLIFIGYCVMVLSHSVWKIRNSIPEAQK